MKHFLLAGSAIAVVALAGAANASTLSFRSANAAAAVGGPISTISATEIGTNSTYYIASESSSILTTGVNAGILALNLDLSGPSTLPSTGVTFTVNLAGNAVFNGAFDSTLIGGSSTCASFTVVPVSGGGDGQQTATFLVSNSASDCEGINFNLPVRMTSAAEGVVAVNTSLSVSGTLIDPPQPSLNVITVDNAFTATISPDTGVVSPYGTDTVIALGSAAPYYTAFETSAGFDLELGSFAISRQPSSYLNLTPSNVTTDGHVTAVNGAVTGTGAGIWGATDLTATGAFNTVNNTVTPPTVSGSGVGSTTLGLNATGGAIPPSSFNLSLATTLEPTLYTASAAPSASGALQNIVRAGVTVMVPWMPSGTRSAIGTRHNVRVSNNSGDEVTVFAEVLNSRNTGSTWTNPGLVTLGTIAAGTSANWTSQAMENVLGDFGQADIRLTVTAAQEQITVKRLVTGQDGNVSELSLGHAGFDVGNSN